MVIPHRYSMFVEFIIDGLETPQIVHISKAGKIAEALQKRGCNFRLGRTS